MYLIKCYGIGVCIDPNSERTLRGTACEATCQQKEKVSCLDLCVEGCFCKQGFIKDEVSNRCIRTKVKDKFEYFPGVWFTYVDDIFATLLGNPKDKIDINEKSGIYEISGKDCDQKYIGQTKRSRFKEHMAHLKYGRTEKSCVAQHAFDNNHRIDINNLNLIENVTNSRQLDAFESLEIIKCNSSMNKDNGPIPTSPLFALINNDSYGSMNRGNKFSINSTKSALARKAY
ncbi:hypothetical protein NQ318_008228 [Aromia moschata]|uniref:TIL domain-containing protein n=1 Tax=Aromia moschata TaxID=1265417 RepID=A0AAV8YJH7_9CUCU|nr:hypothetical protein NQ318_008228 [Aromia moschata]